MSSTTLEIIQGLSQAAANNDGAHDSGHLMMEKKKSRPSKKIGCPIMDKRVWTDSL